jgi:hypothetical protein
MPSDVFDFAATRIDPAGNTLPALMPVEQPGHDTTASYRPDGTFGSLRLTCSPTWPNGTSSGCGGTKSAATGRRTRLIDAPSTAPVSGRSLRATTVAPAWLPGGSNVNHTGARRHRSRSSYWGVFENPLYGHVRGLRSATLGWPEMPTASAGSTPSMRRTVTRAPW